MSDAPIESVAQAGTLYVVATPIGNLSDLSPRALKVLAAVDRIAAEDTRTSGQMLGHFGLRRPMVALHEHNEDAVAAELVARLRQGESLALISDAGTPLVSDPGFALVRAARAAGVPVVAVPGPCAAVAALSISGLPSDSFVFAGFLPAKDAARRKKLEELARETRTLILYESSHRILDSVQAIAEVFGAARRLCLAREMTKLFEQSLTAGAAEVLDWLRQDANRQKGEFVLVVAGAETERTPADRAENLLRVLLRELPPARAAKLAAELTGLKRQELYDLALRVQGAAGPGNT
ncbi:MAG: 16S rRNA (cytidine(1402)-2'-O)-methyltransferase [Gammaproteobacteria bacterium]|nr:16S rRNA (cytidine(1402)-2'-O)-methyltransferase [Gammaproteobacteria bacterium]